MSKFSDSIMPQEPITGRSFGMITTEIKVDVNKLIVTLQENKAKHVETYNEAMKGFKVDYEERLKVMLSNGRHELNINLVEPKSHEEDYDKLIRVLKMETEKTISIGSHELSRVINDEWDWKRGFDATSSLYLAKVRK